MIGNLIQLWKTLVVVGSLSTRASSSNDFISRAKKLRKALGSSEGESFYGKTVATTATTEIVGSSAELISLSERLRNPHLRYDETGLLPCKAGRICAGPGKVYPVGRRVGVRIEGKFVVPPLPKSFDKVETTYYDYLNIFWPHPNPPGYFNQFVPQLMLGNVLANSSNSPYYEPQWLELDSWHIGSQYFMALCRPTRAAATTSNHSTDTYSSNSIRSRLFDSVLVPKSFSTMVERYNCTDWTPKALTGQLIAVEPGEGIFTRLELVSKHVSSTSYESSDGPNLHEWHLTMGVIGDEARTSRLVVDKPFMGMIEPYSNSWMEDIYDNVYVGSCLENYGMFQRDNYPSYWKISVDITLPTDDEEVAQNSIRDAHKNDVTDGILSDGGGYPMVAWNDWKMDHDQDCDWQPKSIVKSTNGTFYQTASWEAW
jgi:hypothetical protein